MKTFATNLKKERMYNKFTQKQMADLLKINLRTYKCYESLGTAGRTPDLELIVQIAKILNTSTDELLGNK